jgi:hypothetical protein
MQRQLRRDASATAIASVARRFIGRTRYIRFLRQRDEDTLKFQSEIQPRHTLSTGPSGELVVTKQPVYKLNAADKAAEKIKRTEGKGKKERKRRPKKKDKMSEGEPESFMSPDTDGDRRSPDASADVLSDGRRSPSQ